MGKGSKRRTENYEAILNNWDKAFGYDEIEMQPLKNTCNHCISNSSMICKFCGKSSTSIQNDGDSFYMEN